MKKVKKLIKAIGPGIITGASDDDPAGIVIYSQAGAQGGYSLLWSAPFLIPFMVVIQEMCARIGMVTGKGLIGTMRKFYPPILIWITTAIVFAANTVNIGADLAAMAASTQLLLPVNIQVLAFFFVILILFFLFFFSYFALIRVLKILTLFLFAYIAATIVSQPDWLTIFQHTILPEIKFDRETLVLFVAILGTTISPYLFFWQASEEAEEEVASGKVDRRLRVQHIRGSELKEMKSDIVLGMFFSNLVMYFIIAAAGSTLFTQGIHTIQTAQEAALALKPIGGELAFFLFTMGIIGTGMLAIPVLAGSAAYAISEALGYEEGFRLPFAKSKAFYGVILASTLTGVGFTIFEFHPFRALFATGVMYGILAPILILIILGIANNKEVMGKRINGFWSNFFGIATFVLMAVTAVSALIL